MMRSPNTPQTVEDVPTERVELGAAGVNRLFDAARTAEFLEEIEQRERGPGRELQALALQLTMWTL
jgi:hypothetical protein